jgi:serine O-acetyltransferase
MSMAHHNTTPSATAPDWQREVKPAFAWDPGRSLLSSIRAYQRCTKSNPLHWIGRKIAVIRHHFWSAISGADIPLNVQIGGGLLIPHPNGIVIHPAAVIGANCLIFQQVTIGDAGGGLPRLGGHIDIGAGAKILGAIQVGDHARIGANAVVIKDVAAGTTVGGIPAHVLNQRVKR